MLGLAFGPIAGGISVEALGRAPVYLVCIPLSAAFTLVAALVSNITGLIICRFFAGLFSSPVLHLGYGMLDDIWTNSYRAWILPAYLFSVLLGSTLGPVVSGYVSEERGIKWTQYTVLFAAGVCLFLVVCMQETSKKAITRYKNGSTGRTPFAKHELHGICVRPFHMLITEPIILAQTLYVAYGFGVLYAIYTALPAVLGEAKAFTVPQQGLAFLSLAIGALIALLMLLGHEYWIYQPRVIRFREETATEDERSLYTGRRSSRLLSSKPSKDSLRPSLNTQNSKRNSIFQSFKGLSTGSWKAAQPQDDRHRNTIMAQAAAQYLAAIEGNSKKQTSAELMLTLLDHRHMEFGHFCTALDNLKLEYDRLELAKVLVEALATNASPSTNLSMYAWGNNSSLNEVELHRKAAVQALEAASVTSLQVEKTPLSSTQHRKTWTPPTNTPPPEWRLWLAMPASCLTAVSLFMLGWTINKNVHWSVPLLATGLYAIGLLIVLVSTIQYVLECYSGIDGSAALAASTTVMFLFAFASTLFATDVLSLGAGPGLSVYASISAALGSVPVLLYHYGPALRRRRQN